MNIVALFKTKILYTITSHNSLKITKASESNWQ